MKCPRIAWRRIVDAGQGLSQAELARAADEAAKAALLSERDAVKTDDLLEQLAARHDMRDTFSGDRTWRARTWPTTTVRISTSRFC